MAPTGKNPIHDQPRQVVFPVLPFPVVGLLFVKVFQNPGLAGRQISMDRDPIKEVIHRIGSLDGHALEQGLDVGIVRCVIESQ